MLAEWIQITNAYLCYKVPPPPLSKVFLSELFLSSETKTKKCYQILRNGNPIITNTYPCYQVVSPLPSFCPSSIAFIVVAKTKKSRPHRSYKYAAFGDLSINSNHTMMFLRTSPPPYRLECRMHVCMAIRMPFTVWRCRTTPSCLLAEVSTLLP